MMIVGVYGSKQKGAVLFVSLVLLLVMTLIGVTAMTSTTLQERMAGNTGDRNSAFQASEAALREGERWLLTNVAATQLNAQLLDGGAWDGQTNPVPSDQLLGFDTARLAMDPVFYVDPPELIRIGAGIGSESLQFRCTHAVTSYGVGGTETAVVILRSQFVPQPTCD